ncbi:hypothetical protein J6590_027178 [Homalodisca vitripennis]|nr:hypothetical protein J6590_027178 [Homalodisca vitripennis]
MSTFLGAVSSSPATDHKQTGIIRSSDYQQLSSRGARACCGLCKTEKYTVQGIAIVSRVQCHHPPPLTTDRQGSSGALTTSSSHLEVPERAVACVKLRSIQCKSAVSSSPATDHRQTGVIWSSDYQQLSSRGARACCGLCKNEKYTVQGMAIVSRVQCHHPPPLTTDRQGSSGALTTSSSHLEVPERAVACIKLRSIQCKSAVSSSLATDHRQTGVIRSSHYQQLSSRGARACCGLCNHVVTPPSTFLVRSLIIQRGWTARLPAQAGPSLYNVVAHRRYSVGNTTQSSVGWYSLLEAFSLFKV